MFILSYMVEGERRRVQVSSPEVAREMVLDINSTNKGPFHSISDYDLVEESEDAMEFPWMGKDMISFREYVDEQRD